jgi:eukaryotic-like serine/threonine-protein kinase
MAANTGKIAQHIPPGEVDSYEFGSFRLDVGQRSLTKEGEAVKLPPKTLDLLLFLISRNGLTVDKSTLMEALWEGAFVEEANLTVHVSRLRKLFADDEPPAATIETFPKIGYRFTAELQEYRAEEKPVVGPAGSEDHPQSAGNGKIGDAPADPPFPIPAVAKAGSDRARIITAALVIAVVIFGSGYLMKEWYGGSKDNAPTVIRVPGTEQSSQIAFSPNGEYIAHTVSKDGKRTLTLTHVGGSSLPLLPTDDSSYAGLTFSRDGSHLYFVKGEPGTAALFRIPVLGGPVTRVLDRVDNRVSFSPDGSQFCFVRNIAEGVTAIMIANSDGSSERELARRSSPEFYSGFEISWSPDGKLIANAGGSSGNNPNFELIGVEVETGKELVIHQRKWGSVDGLEWLRDGSGLVAGIFEGPGSTTQVWFIPFPAGEPRRITTDLENYGSVGVSADGSTIMAGQFRDNTSIWVGPPGDASGIAPVKAGKHHKFNWVRWTADGGYVFGSDATGNRDVWRMGPDGSGERQLTNGPQSNVMPVATSDGRFIVFSAFRDNNGLFEIWRMGPDGSGQVQLTPSGSGAWQPALSPDGQWIFYTSGPMDGPPMKRRIWKVPIEGGEPAQLIDLPAFQPDISPDGRYLACWIKQSEKAKPQAAIFPIEGGQPIKIFDGPTGNRLDWTPDGKGLSYIVTTDGVSNIWTQPVDGGQPRQETKFTSETIRNFEWSRDGGLMVSRYFKTRDVVLIRNFR